MLVQRSGSTLVRIAAVFVVLILAAAASAALSASKSTWRVVKKKTASGENPTLTISATVRHPLGLGVRGSSPTHVGSSIRWNCTKGFTVRHWRLDVMGGFYALPHVRGKDSCRVFVTSHGRDRITVTILKRTS